jgi:hypothetical protein
LIAECGVGRPAERRSAALRVAGELHQESHHGLRDHAPRDVRGRDRDRHHGLDRHARGRVHEKRSPLGQVAAHRQQPLQGIRAQVRDEAGHPSAQGNRVLSFGRTQLVGDLEQVADDDLLVGIRALEGRLLVDGIGHHFRIGIRLRFSVGCHVERGLRERQPELRGTGHAAWLAFVRAVLIFNERQAVIGLTIELDVIPDRLGGRGRVRFAGQALQEVRELRGREARDELDACDPVGVEPARERAQEVIACVGGDAVDDQLVAGDAHGERVSRREQRTESLEHALLRRLERWMPARVHRSPLGGDRQLE